MKEFFLKFKHSIECLNLKKNSIECLNQLILHFLLNFSCKTRFSSNHMYAERRDVSSTTWIITLKFSDFLFDSNLQIEHKLNINIQPKINFEFKNSVTAVAQSVKSSAPERSAWDRGSPGKNYHLCYWHLVHVKSVVGAMSSKFPSKLYLWGYQSGGAILFLADKIAMARFRIRLFKFHNKHNKLINIKRSRFGMCKQQKRPVLKLM